jgi:hypothetical protein
MRDLAIFGDRPAHLCFPPDPAKTPDGMTHGLLRASIAAIAHLPND